MRFVLNRRMMVLLFMSSYSPLFFLLGLRSYGKSTPIFVLSGVALGASLAGLGLFLLIAGSRSPEDHRVVSAERRDADVAGYAATYLLPFLAIFGAGWRDVLALALFIALLGVLYVNSRTIYVNPVLAVMGYHLYVVRTTTAPIGAAGDVGASRWLVIKRLDVAADEPIRVRQVTGDALFAFPWDTA